jgi:hypothetical protein
VRAKGSCTEVVEGEADMDEGGEGCINMGSVKVKS